MHQSTRIMRSQMAVLAIVLGLVAALANAVSCPASTCNPLDPNLRAVWLNTTAMASVIQGLSVTTYPMTIKFPEAFQDAFSSIHLTDLQELQPFRRYSCDKDTLTASHSGEQAFVLKHFSAADLCCDVAVGWEMMEPSINKTFATVVASSPDYPSFRLLLNFSLTNESISYVHPGSNYTNGTDWSETYSPLAAKITIDVANWPWVAKGFSNGTTYPSYLKFFMISSVNLDEDGNVTLFDAGMTASFYATSTKVHIENHFLKVFTIDGVDHAMSLIPAPHPTGFFTNSFSGPVVLTACQGASTIEAPYYWDHFEYDPTLSALFSDNAKTNPSGEPIAESPLAKSVSRKTGIIVGSVFGALVAVVIVLALLFTFNDTARHCIRPYSARSENFRPTQA